MRNEKLEIGEMKNGREMKKGREMKIEKEWGTANCPPPAAPPLSSASLLCLIASNSGSSYVYCAFNGFSYIQLKE
jgi:hypothetical protein